MIEKLLLAALDTTFLLMPHPRAIKLSFPLSGAFDCEPEDLEGLAGVEHFGVVVGWYYGQVVDGWPPDEPRPLLPYFGSIQIGQA